MNNSYIPGDFLPAWFAIPAITILWLLLIIMVLRERKKTRDAIRNLNKQFAELPDEFPKMYFMQDGKWRDVYTGKLHPMYEKKEETQ